MINDASPFSGFNVFELLSLGITGFGFLLTLMSFYLIYKEQSREGAARNPILLVICFFITVNVGVIIFVGILGLPAISKNRILEQTAMRLEENNNQKDAVLSVLNKSNKLDSLALQHVDPQTPKVSDAVTAEFLESYLISLDSLTTRTKGKLNDSLIIAKRDLTEIKKLYENNQSSQKTFDKIILTKDKVAKWAMETNDEVVMVETKNQKNTINN